jgi:hypothetical protein
VGSNVELLVLGPLEVLGAELDQEGAPVEPLLRGDPMEPADPNRDRSSDLIRRGEIPRVRISVAGGVGAEEGGAPLDEDVAVGVGEEQGQDHLLRPCPSLAVPEEEGTRKEATARRRLLEVVGRRGSHDGLPI